MTDARSVTGRDKLKNIYKIPLILSMHIPWTIRIFPWKSIVKVNLVSQAVNFYICEVQTLCILYLLVARLPRNNTPHCSAGTSVTLIAGALLIRSSSDQRHRWQLCIFNSLPSAQRRLLWSSVCEYIPTMAILGYLGGLWERILWFHIFSSIRPAWSLLSKRLPRHSLRTLLTVKVFQLPKLQFPWAKSQLSSLLHPKPLSIEPKTSSCTLSQLQGETGWLCL